MTELSFTKTYLSTLDARPIKLQSDYVANPKTLEITAPYTLPRTSKPMQKPSTTGASADSATSSQQQQHQDGADPSSLVTVVLKSSLRTSTSSTPSASQSPAVPAFTGLTVPDLPIATTSILDLKSRIADSLNPSSSSSSSSSQNLDLSKIKILYERKPVSDVKTLKEVLSSSSSSSEPPQTQGNLEFSVMIMGGYSTSTSPAPAADKMDIDSPNPSGASVLKDEAFWTDLTGFLEQRVRDAGVAKDAVKVFRDAWVKRQ